MLRCSLHLVGDPIDVEMLLRSLAMCRVYVASVRGRDVELWLWCSDVHTLLILFEQCLQLGFIPIALGLLNGRLVPIERLDFTQELLYRLATTSLDLQGRIEVEWLSNTLRWVDNILNLVNVNSLRIDYRKRRAVIETKKRINTTQLFDNMLRVTKPRRIPP